MHLRHKTYALFVLVALSLGMPFNATGETAVESSSGISNLFTTRSAKIAGVGGIGATALALLCIKAHKKMVLAEKINPKSLLAQKARIQFEKLRAVFLALVLGTTVAATHAYMSPASDPTANTITATKPSLPDNKSDGNAAASGIITPPPSNKGTGVGAGKKKENDTVIGDTSGAAKPPITGGDTSIDTEADSEDELIEPEEPLSAAEKAERMTATTARGKQLQSEINKLKQRVREIEDAIEGEVQAKMRDARAAIDPHDNDDDHDNRIDLKWNLLRNNPEYQGIQESLGELYTQTRGIEDEITNLEIAGRAYLKKRLERCEERQGRLNAQLKRLAPLVDSATKIYSKDTMMKDEKIAASNEALARSSEAFAKQFERAAPELEDIMAYLNEPYHYGKGADEELLAAYESLEKLSLAFHESVVEKIITMDKNLKKFPLLERQLMAAQREQACLEAQISLLETEHTLAATKAQCNAAQKAKESLEAARELLIAQVKLSRDYTDASRRQVKARELLENASPGFMAAYTASRSNIDSRDYYERRQHFQTTILDPLLNDEDLWRAWHDIEAEQETLDVLRSEQEYSDPDYLAAQAAFKDANDPEHRGSDLLKMRKNLLERQQQCKAFLAKRKAS